MENKQSIACDVKACRYNKMGCQCSLDAIKVTHGSEVPTAHYCESYEE